PTITAVRSGEAELSRITGAKTPSGIPVTITPPTPEPARRTTTGASASARGRRGRTTRGRTTGKHRTT
ncbi:ATP-dependent helicase, partial [Streptomyces sp. NPDC047043]